MRGLAYFDASCSYIGDCNFCGDKLQCEGTWIYKEGNVRLCFCSYNCTEKFLELNKLQDVEED